MRTIRVPQAALGNSLTDDGRYLLIADGSEGATVVSVARAEKREAHAALAVVSVAAALAHRHAILGTIRAGSFPREMALEPKRNILLVGNLASQQLEAVGIGSHR